jgi:thiol-disulfide isomerase/thioredoxin
MTRPADAPSIPTTTATALDREVQAVKANEFLSRLHLPVESRLPTFDGAKEWINSEPLGPDDLHGKVVLTDFWTFTCINWLRTLPYIRAWYEAYGAHGLLVVGVHTPEFGVEHDIDNIRSAVRAMGIEYPVAVDNDYAVWDAFANRAWPAIYIADAEGRIRHHHLGEGGEEQSEHVIRRLLKDAGADTLPDAPAPIAARGIEIPADWRHLRSPETYVGLARSEGFASPEGAAFDAARAYSVPSRLHVNEWALAGDWTIGREEATSNAPSGRIAYRFHARDLHLILTPPVQQQPGRFRVLLDGSAPGDAHGLDVDADGNGVVGETRLYQLIRQPGDIRDRLFEIEILDPGTAALCFTFG